MNIGALIIVLVLAVGISVSFLVFGLRIGKSFARELKDTHPESQLTRKLTKSEMILHGVMVLLLFSVAAIAQLAPNSFIGAQFQGPPGVAKGLLIFVSLSVITSIAIGLYEAYLATKKSA